MKLLRHVFALTPIHLLIAHGSRDPRPQIALERLTYLVNQQLAGVIVGQNPVHAASLDGGKTHVAQGGGLSLLTRPQTLVLSANLECQALPLHRQIVQLLASRLGEGVTRVNVLPLFLSPGAHVCEDLPRELAIAQQVLGSRCEFQVLPHLGGMSSLVPWLASVFAQYDPRAQRILLAHGSRRPGGNEAIAQVAQQLQAQVAFWKTLPSLAELLPRLSSSLPVVILPYFLFAGSITDSIQTHIQQLQQDYLSLSLTLGSPLGPNLSLAALIAEQLGNHGINTSPPN